MTWTLWNTSPLLHFSVHVLVFSYMTFFLPLFVPHLSFFSCLGKAMLCDCGISWEVSLMFSYMTFVLPLFYLYISPSFRALERLCFVIVAFSGDFHSCFHIWRLFCHCFISTSLLLFVPRKGCALWLWHFLGSFTNVFLYDVCFSIVLSPHLSFFSCLGKVVLCDCGISWEVSLMFSYMTFVFPLFYLYISPSFRASERLCFVIVAFPGKFH